MASGSTRRRTGAVELREAAKAATRSCGTLAAKEAALRVPETSSVLVTTPEHCSGPATQP